MALLFELAKKMEMSTHEGLPSEDAKGNSELSCQGSSPKKLELTPSRSNSVVEKVNGLGSSSALGGSEFSEPEWEPDVNLVWTTRQVTEELWRSWSGNDIDLGEVKPSNSGENEEQNEEQNEEDLSDLPPPPPPPPLPPPPENVDMFSLSTALGFCPDGDFTTMNTAGAFTPTMWPYAPFGFCASPDFYGTFAAYDHVNDAAAGKPHYWHESTFNSFKKGPRHKHESLIDLAVARRHLEQQLQLSEKQGEQSSQRAEQPQRQEQPCEKQPNFCTFCGGKFQPSSKFCMFCGSAVSLSAC